MPGRRAQPDAARVDDGPYDPGSDAAEESPQEIPTEFPDILPAVARGRGAQRNPGNRFETGESGRGIRLHILGDHIDEELREHSEGVQRTTNILADRTESLINPINAPDLPMSWTINPYRGCEHGCIYCYARPGHEYLGMSCGIDFETKILAKHDAPAILRRELARPKWTGEPISMSGVTDCYQPIEKKLGITRGCLEVMAQCRQPVGIVTKNRLVTRDIDLLSAMWRNHRCAKVAISLTTLDAGLAAKMEPRTSTPRDRLRAMRELADAGVPVTVMTAPIIPGINDHELPRLLEAAADHGATTAGWTMLRLPWQIKDLFLDWLARHLPDRAAKVERFIRDMRGGDLYQAGYGTRMRGEGEHAQLIATMFRKYRTRYRLDRETPPLSMAHFRRPNLDGQLDLFD